MLSPARPCLPAATGDIIATVDGDGTYPSAMIAPLIDDLLNGGLDFISASRFPLQDERAMRKLMQALNLKVE